MCGQKAVELTVKGSTGIMITIQRQQGDKYNCTTGTAKLSEVAIKAKPMPDEYINTEGNFVTDKFVEYIKPLVGDMPKYIKLKYQKV